MQQTTNSDDLHDRRPDLSRCTERPRPFFRTAFRRCFFSDVERETFAAASLPQRDALSTAAFTELHRRSRPRGLVNWRRPAKDDGGSRASSVDR